MRRLACNVGAEAALAKIASSPPVQLATWADRWMYPLMHPQIGYFYLKSSLSSTRTAPFPTRAAQRETLGRAKPTAIAGGGLQRHDRGMDFRWDR